MPDPVELYLIRHGLAGSRSRKYPDDRLRPLTSRGIVALRREGKGLARLGLSFDLILTSPLVRARQTADELAAAFDPPPPIVETDALAPGATRSGVVDTLGGYRRERRIALVGHEPDLGKLAAAFTGLRQPLPFKKGGLCRIDLPGPARPSGTLVWVLPPRVLRRIRG